jgi:hypothetical protein
MNYEYKVIPAPTKGLKAKGVKSGADRFSNALETAINVMAAEGWEYLRAETLPSEEREGLMGKATVYQNVLVFKRTVAAAEDVPVAAVDEEIEDEDAALEENQAEVEATVVDEQSVTEIEPSEVETIDK